MKAHGNRTALVKNAFLTLLSAGMLSMGLIAYDQYARKENAEAMMEDQSMSIENHLNDVYSQIENNLAEISAHEDIIRANLAGNESGGILSPEERIQREVEVISVIMERNDHLISALKNEVGDKDNQIKKYASKVKGLNRRIDEYMTRSELLSMENRELSENLALSSQENSNLSNELNYRANEIIMQNQLIENQIEELKNKDDMIHRAYFKVGTYQDLKDEDILTKVGGIVGIGATKQLKSDFDKSKFTEIDRRTYKTIPIFSNKADLITSHDVQSYEWERDQDGIKWMRIINPDKFWEKSKFLVVVISDGVEISLAEPRGSLN